MKKIILTVLLAVISIYADNNLIVLNDEEDSDVAELEIRGNGESCRLDFESTGKIYNSSCHSIVNSKGVRIYCTAKKKMCKTYDEIHAFVFEPQPQISTSTTNISEENTKGYSREYKRCLDNSGGVTSEMRNCNGTELKYQDSLLNRHYKQAMKVLDTAHRDELKKIQRLWMKYRDAKCGFLFGLTGGTMDLIIGGGCHVDMTAQRATELKAIADTL